MALVAVFALVLSALSMLIKTGTDTIESKTIGIVTKWGFPIHYRITASGLAWAQFNGIRFWLNSAVWLAALLSIMILVVFIKNRNKPKGLKDIS